MPSVAVVIPAYNAERTLGATIASVIDQTFSDFELVIVDDGSGDSTYQLAEGFAQQDERIRLVRQANRGLADARNAGIQNSTSPLIAAIDCDDIWHPTFLEKLSASFVDGETLLAYANSRIIDLQDQVIWNAPSYRQAGWVLNQLLLLNFIGNGSAMMFRREPATALGLYERRLQYEYGAAGCEDWLLALRLAAHGKVAAVPEYLIGYRAVPGAMSQNTLRMRRSRLFAVEQLFKEIDIGKCRTGLWSLGIAHAKCFLHELAALQLGAAYRDLTQALQLDFLGTLRLLFGTERLDWLLDKIPGRGDSETPLGSFNELGTRDGQWEVEIPRADTARQWDDEAGRIVTSGMAASEASSAA